MTLLEKINDRMDKRHKEGTNALPEETNITNPPLGRDREARAQFQYLTDANLDEEEHHEEITNTIGTVHVSRPSIKHVFFLLRPVLKPLLEQFQNQEHQLAELVKLLTLEHVFIDRPVALSVNVSYDLNYLGRKYAYIMNLTAPYTPQLGVNGVGLEFLSPGIWYPLQFPAGSKISLFNINDPTPVTCTIRLTDIPINQFTQVGTGFNNIGTVQIGAPLTPNGGLGVIVGATVRTVFSNNQTSNANFTSPDQAVGDLATLDVDIVFGGFTGGTTPGITYNIARKDAFGNYNVIWSSGNKTAAFSTFLSIGAGVQQGSAPGANVVSVGVDFGDIIQINWVITGAPTSITQATTIKGKTY